MFDQGPYPFPAVIAVVDDDAGALAGLCRMVDSWGFDVHAFSNPEHFLKVVSEVRPHVVLIDVYMPEMSGLTMLARLRERALSMPAVFLTGCADIPRVVQAMQAGAIDFLEKPCSDEVLLDAIRRALEVVRLEHQVAERDADARTRWAMLTPREREVCSHVVQGELNKQVAAVLGTKEKTIKVHRAHAMAKLGTRSVAELVRLVDRVGHRSARTIANRVRPGPRSSPALPSAR